MSEPARWPSSTSAPFEVLQATTAPEVVDNHETDLSTPVLALDVEPTKIGFMRRIKDTISAAREDWSDSILRGKIFMTTAVAAQVADRGRLAEILGPSIAINTYTSTGSKWQAAGVLAGYVYVQQFVSGAALGGALKYSPKTIDTFNSNFPKAVDYARDVAPSEGGVIDAFRNGRSESEGDTLNRLRGGFSESGKEALNAVREGSGGFGLGSMPYILAEKFAEPEVTLKQSIKTTERISHRTAAFAAGVVVGALSIYEAFPESDWTDTFMTWAKSPWLYTGIALLMESGRLTRKRMKRNKTPTENIDQSIAQESFPSA